jgi:hypothetical protein
MLLPHMYTTVSKMWCGAVCVSGSKGKVQEGGFMDTPRGWAGFLGSSGSLSGRVPCFPQMEQSSCSMDWSGQILMSVRPEQPLAWVSILSISNCISLTIGGHLVRYPWSAISDWAWYRNFWYRTERASLTLYQIWNKILSNIWHPIQTWQSQ